MNKVLSTFDNKAKTYNSASNRLPWSLLRKREAASLGSMLGSVSGLNALEFGCGAGFYTRMLIALGIKHITAIDMSQAMIQQLPKERVTGIAGNAEMINLDEKFEVILSAGMLEFTQEPEKVIKNARAHASVGSVMIILVPKQCFWGKFYHCYHKYHGFNIHLFQVSELLDITERNNWLLSEFRNVWPFTLLMKFKAV